MTLHIEVNTPDLQKVGNFKTLLRNSIALNMALEYDYQGLIRGLKLLYPNRQIIINLKIVDL